MASLSEKLRRERELRGISIKQISEETKIGVRFLEALEEDRLELIPGEFYRRSYLRAYARYLGLDEDRAVNAYSYTQQEAPVQREESPHEETTSPQAGKILWLGLIVVLVVVTFFMIRAGGEDPARQASPPREASQPLLSDGAGATSGAPESHESAPPTVPMLTSEESSDRGGALRLVLSVAEPCWLEIEADGEVVTSGLKEEGFRQEFTANEEVRLWLGNAGGVSLWVNDRKAKPLGRSGQVRKDLSITPANYRDFVIENDIS